MSEHTTRRLLLKQAAALGAALAFGQSCATTPTGPRTERRDLFPHGVSSGDPAPDSVILWTRREPGAGATAHRLVVEVASDEAFASIVARGDVEVTAATDWTCRFLAAGLRPAREYWYRFVDEAGNTSRTGRTITAPAANDDRPVRFAFVSCQDPTNSALNAYRRMIYEDARRPRAEQMSFVLHLGDFIYEMIRYPEDTPDGLDRGRRLRDGFRYPNGKKVRRFNYPIDLNDYRAAYKNFLADPDLQDARARWPFVPVWDNHEFSWQGYQSQEQIFGEAQPKQTLKVAASQAWYEYQPARVTKPGAGDPFEAPSVTDAPLTERDARGVYQEPNNLIAIRALQIQRAFRFGKNIDMILTDNRSFQSAPIDGSNLPVPDFGLTPEIANDVLEAGREYNGGSPPATIRLSQAEVPNPQINEPPQAYLGIEQMAWFKDRLRAAQAPWKIWGHSFGTLTLRSDPQNLPPEFAATWPSTEYGDYSRSYVVEHAEIFGMVRDEGITGLTICVGDKHSFWAGYTSETLPPRPYEPVGVEFVTGSISQAGAAEVQALTFPRDGELRPFYVHDRPDGSTQCALNTMLLHGVRSALVLRDTDDLAQARAASNPDNAPNLEFLDFGGYGYSTVRASPDELETEFVCIPPPLERAETEDGGPLRYRVVHRVSRWAPGQRPHMRQEVIEGDVGTAI